MSADSYSRVIVYNPQEKRHIVRDAWYLASNDEVLTAKYSDMQADELKAAVQVLDALHGNASAYMAFLHTFLKPKGND